MTYKYEDFIYPFADGDIHEFLSRPLSKVLRQINTDNPLIERLRGASTLVQALHAFQFNQLKKEQTQEFIPFSIQSYKDSFYVSYSTKTIYKHLLKIKEAGLIEVKDNELEKFSTAKNDLIHFRFKPELTKHFTLYLKLHPNGTYRYYNTSTIKRK